MFSRRTRAPTTSRLLDIATHRLFWRRHPLAVRPSSTLTEPMATPRLGIRRLPCRTAPHRGRRQQPSGWHPLAVRREGTHGIQSNRRRHKFCSARIVAVPPQVRLPCSCGQRGVGQPRRRTMRRQVMCCLQMVTWMPCPRQGASLTVGTSRC